MGKTFEALERAEKEFLRRKYSTAVHAGEKYRLGSRGKAAAPVKLLSPQIKGWPVYFLSFFVASTKLSTFRPQ